MVIKGNARGGAVKLADHLARLDTNEHMELIEARGVLADDLHGALAEMEAVATGTRSKRPLYHASINTRADEVLTPEQRDQAIDRLEQELGLTGQPRVVVAHVKEGRAHHHVVWSRIDLENMKAIPDSFNYRKHELVARDLEREFGHARVQGAHVERNGQPRPDRTPSHAEMQQAERTGYSAKEMKAAVTELWQTTDSGQALVAAVADRGWQVAQGDRRDFVIVDEFGEVHSIARRITGAKAADVRERMRDVDRDGLPDVEMAQAAQLAAAQQRAIDPPQILPEILPAIEAAPAMDYGHDDRSYKPRDPEELELAPTREGELPDERQEDIKRARMHEEALAATSDGGMVAQQREAMTLLQRRVEARQALAKQLADEARRALEFPQDRSRSR